jgi:hypothetical protein
MVMPAGSDPLALHNAYRAAHGAPALAADSDLASMAKTWVDAQATGCGFDMGAPVDSGDLPVGFNMAVWATSGPVSGPDWEGTIWGW